MTTRAVLAAIVATAALGCAGARPVPQPPPTIAALPGDGFRVALLWTAPVDLDLYVTDPHAVTLYFANSPTRAGVLTRDARCPAGDPSTDAPRVEVARFPDPIAGVYRVGVDFIDRCGAPDAPIAYRVVADVGRERRETTGIIAPLRFQPLALEISVPAREESR